MTATPAGVYLPQPEFEAAVAAAVLRGGERLTTEVIGRSVEGRALTAVRIAAPGRRPDPGRPAALAIGAIHGMEVVASELALALIEDAIDRPHDPFVAALLDVADLVVVPVVNPDSRAGAVESLRRNRVWNSCRRGNSNGVDLNRNWPVARGGQTSRLPIAGTDVSWLPWFRGVAPFSEPETAALAELGRRIRPVGLVNLHSSGRLVTYPWSSRPDPCPDAEGFERMVSAFQGAQSTVRYRAKQSHAWYPISGSSNEWFYDELGSLAITVELSPTTPVVREELLRWRVRRARWLFWWANPLDPGPEIDATSSACLAALAASAAWHAEGKLVIDPALPVGEG